jgi:hypothetical protein
VHTHVVAVFDRSARSGHIGESADEVFIPHLPPERSMVGAIEPLPGSIEGVVYTHTTAVGRALILVATAVQAGALALVNVGSGDAPCRPAAAVERGDGRARPDPSAQGDATRSILRSSIARSSRQASIAVSARSRATGSRVWSRASFSKRM